VLYIASAITASAVLLVALLVARYRFADYRKMVYVDEAGVARMRATRRASERSAA
jgi:hypothetical protein